MAIIYAEPSPEPTKTTASREPDPPKRPCERCIELDRDPPHDAEHQVNPEWMHEERWECDGCAEAAWIHEQERRLER